MSNKINPKIKAKIAELDAQLSEFHDARDHRFTPSQADPTICGVCGWYGPDGMTLFCGHTNRQHAQRRLAELRGEPVPDHLAPVIAFMVLTPEAVDVLTPEEVDALAWLLGEFLNE